MREFIFAELEKFEAATSKLAESTWATSKIIIRSTAARAVEIVYYRFYLDSGRKINRREIHFLNIPEENFSDWVRARLRANRGEVDITREIQEIIRLKHAEAKFNVQCNF